MSENKNTAPAVNQTNKVKAFFAGAAGGSLGNIIGSMAAATVVGGTFLVTLVGLIDYEALQNNTNEETAKAATETLINAVKLSLIPAAIIYGGLTYYGGKVSQDISDSAKEYKGTSMVFPIALAIISAVPLMIIAFLPTDFINNFLIPNDSSVDSDSLFNSDPLTRLIR